MLNDRERVVEYLEKHLGWECILTTHRVHTCTHGPKTEDDNSIRGVLLNMNERSLQEYAVVEYASLLSKWGKYGVYFILQHKGEIGDVVKSYNPDRPYASWREEICTRLNFGNPIILRPDGTREALNVKEERTLTTVSETKVRFCKYSDKNTLLTSSNAILRRAAVEDFRVTQWRDLC